MWSTVRAMSASSWGIAVAVAGDQRADLNPAGQGRPVGEHRPALEVQTGRVTGEGKEVVPVEDHVDAEFLHPGDHVDDLIPGGVLRRDLHPEPQGPLLLVACVVGHETSFSVGAGSTTYRHRRSRQRNTAR
jgi:hypothetical protein